MIQISLLYAGILSLFGFGLTANVVRHRMKVDRGLFYDTDPNNPLHRAVRLHGNFFEYVPFLILLLALDEFTGRNSTILHILGISILLGRVLHFVGLSKTHGKSWERIAGMSCTFTALAWLGVNLILKGVG